MDWHRTLVSILLAVSTVLALMYMSSLEPEAAALAPQPAGISDRQEPQPQGSPQPAPGQQRYALRDGSPRS